MEASAGRKPHLSVLIVLFLITLEGSLAIATLLNIPGDIKNAWLMGFSTRRWAMVTLLFSASTAAAWGLWTGLRYRSKFERWTGRLAEIFCSPKRWAILMTLLLTSALLSFSITLNLITFSYTASDLNKVRIGVLLSIFFLQAFVFLGGLYIDSHYESLVDILPRKKVGRRLVILFAISFAVRAAFAYPVIASETPPQFDEYGYYEVTNGLVQITKDILAGNRPSSAVLERTYYEGRWPPLHPILLAAVNLIFNGGLSSARWSVVVLSSLTTVVAYATGKTVAGEKAGLGAAIFHIAYPSFIAYAHYLWSETTYIFFLLICMLCIVRMAEENVESRRIFFAFAAGIILGLSGLVRTTSLPFLLMLPLWIYFSRPKQPQKGFIAALIPILCLIVWMPWLMFLQGKEGRFIPLATTGGYNLYLGNNPIGSSEERTPLISNMDAYAKRNSISRDQAASELAMREIEKDPGAFIERSFDRAIHLWSSDTFLSRHIFNLAYPPMPNGVVLWIWGISLSSYLAFWLFTINGISAGVIDNRFKWLVFLLVGSGMALPIISIAITRLHLPLMAMMLPFTGLGLVQFREGWDRSKVIRNIATSTAVLIVIGVTLPGNVEGYRPSGYYMREMKAINAWMNIEGEFKDRLALKMTGEGPKTFVIRILTEGYTFKENFGRQYRWKATEAEREIILVLVSQSGRFPVRIEVSQPDEDISAIIEPFEPTSWMNWKETNLGVLEYSWTGGD